MAFNADMDTSDIETRFTQIAKMLFENFALQKGNTIYLFKEIEFYFYNRNHHDIITHPRSSESLHWYVNDFGGIDLNLSSSISSKKTNDSKKFVLDDNSYFGGILIRQLINRNRTEVLNGPWACAELFRCHNATGHDKAFPLLVEHKNCMAGYIRKPRLNILKSKQTITKKVDYILGNYREHPTKDELYKDFSTFKDKRYRYVCCDQLMHDNETNEVYLSLRLKEEHPEFYERLSNSLKSCGIEPQILKHTKDYWVRDYMPIQLEKNEFLKYRYYPDYLVKSKNSEDAKTITDCSKVLCGMGINSRSTKLIIDGGNMVSCGPYIVMTDKVFTENNCEKGDDGFKALLESELNHPVIIIPWTMHGNLDDSDTDKYGHSDGFIKWCGDNRILMGNHGDEYPEEAVAIRVILEEYGFTVTEMKFTGKVSSPHTDLNWAYINFLQVGNNIFMPSFNIEEDTIACQYIHDAFPNCEIHQIEMTEIAKEGGALHCISWNIQRTLYR